MQAYARFRLFVLGLVALTVLLALPGGSLAAKPTFHDNFTDTFASNLCGVDGTSTIRVNQIGTDTGTSFKVSGEYTEVFTAADGRRVTIHTAGQSTGYFVDNGNGRITFFNSYKGLPEQVRGTGGGVATRDAGLLTFATTVDFSGPDPVLVGRELVVERGPHPEADADFAIFCAVVLTALG